MELLTFRIAHTFFGISVAKVREVIERVSAVWLPYSSAEVEGIFKLRDEVLTLINLGRYMGMTGEETVEGKGSIIVVEFNNIRCGVLVDAVDAIHRLHWDDIVPPSEYLTKNGAPITGTVMINKNTILIIDFERLLEDILNIKVTREEHIEIDKATQHREVRILFVEDSIVMRKSLMRIMQAYGYKNINACNDGQDGWQYLQEHIEDENGPCDIIVTDIEMPRMDGITFTARIKKDARLRSIPVVIYSSLMGEDIHKQGNAAGADALVGKPETNEMIQAIESCLDRRETPQAELAEAT